MKNYNIDALKILIRITLFSSFCLTYNLSAQTESNWANPLNRCWVNQIDNSFALVNASDNGQNLNNLSNTALLFSQNSIKHINASNGDVNWETKIGGQILFEPIVIENTIFLLSKTETENSYPYLNSIDIKSGLHNWKKEIPFGWRLFGSSNNKRIFLIKQNKSISSIKMTDGNLEWITELKNEISNLLSAEGKIFLLTEQNKIIIISEIDGKIEDELKTKDKIISIKKSRTELFWADAKGNITSFNLQGRKIVWHRKIGGRISNINSYKNTLFISSLDNFIYFFNVKNGKILLRRRLDGRILNKPAIQDSIFAISAYNSLQISIFDAKKNMLINQISLSDADLFVESFIFAGKYLIITTPKSISAYSFKC